MKTVKKKTADELCRVVRKFWKTGDEDILAKKHEILCQLSKECYGDTNKWSIFNDLSNSAFSSYGFKPKATNQFFYDLLAMFDIDVVEAEAEE